MLIHIKIPHPACIALALCILLRQHADLQPVFAGSKVIAEGIKPGKVQAGAPGSKEVLFLPGVFVDAVFDGSGILSGGNGNAHCNCLQN